MKRTWHSLGTGLEWCGAICLVAVSLPLIAVTAFLLRGLLLAAALLGIVSVIGCYFLFPRFRGWVDHCVGHPKGALMPHVRH